MESGHPSGYVAGDLNGVPSMLVRSHARPA